MSSVLALCLESPQTLEQATDEICPRAKRHQPLGEVQARHHGRHGEVSSSYDVCWFTDGNITPLHLAVRCRHTSVVKQSIDKVGHDWPRGRAVIPLVICRIQEAMGNKFNQHFDGFFARRAFSAGEFARFFTVTRRPLWPSQLPRTTISAKPCACMLGDLYLVEAICKHPNARPYHGHSGMISYGEKPAGFPPLRCTWLSCRVTVQRSPSSSSEVCEPMTSHRGPLSERLQRPCHHLALQPIMQPLSARPSYHLCWSPKSPTCRPCITCTGHHISMRSGILMKMRWSF